MNEALPPNVRKILVIHVSRIGDTLLVTPALRAIAQAFPKAHITCLAHPKRRQILQHLPSIDRLGEITKFRARLLGRFSRRRFDLAFVFGFDQPLVAYALRVANHVVAFRQGNASLDQRLWRVVEPPPFQSCHAVDYLLAMTDAVGLPRAGRRLSYRVTSTEQAWAAAKLLPVRSTGAAPLIGMQVASFPTKGYRDWPIGNFIELCQRIRAEYPKAHFLIFGGRLEHDRTKALHDALPGCSSLYAGQLSLRQTAALMNEVDLYVGVDTGPTHIMGALHRPMVALYHGYSPSRLLAPLERPHLWVVDHPRAGEGNSIDAYAMSDITVEAVLARVREALACMSP